MNDEQTEAVPDAVTKVARDLREIEDLSAQLEPQAIHKANAIVDGTGLPGGAAMVSLAGVANQEAWQNIVDTAMRTAYENGIEPPEIDDEDEWEPVLQTLCFWSEGWRLEHGNDYGVRPTITSEAGYIRHSLTWAWDNEPKWDDFARDIRKARVRLENVLYAGRRAKRTRVPCNNPECDSKPRLIKVYRDKTDGSEDHYRCPACKFRYDDDAFNRAYARQLQSQGAERYVSIMDAVGTLRALGRSERTIRKWLTECKADAWCDPRTREQWVWWPDLWRLHLSTATRKRETKQIA